MTDASLTFVGNATTLLRLGRFTVLTDPNFIRKGQRAYLGHGLWTRRLTDPAMGIDELPRLDAVVLSHLHGDHFDRVARQGLDRAVPVVTTSAAADRLGDWGFTAHGLATWARWSMQDGDEELTVESLPGLHARGLLGRLLPPVMGSLLTHTRGGQVLRRVYLSGDTLTGPHLDAVRERHPDIDVAVMHLGGTRVLFATVTMDDGQGVDFLRRVAPRQAVPVHHDDYTVFRSPVSEFVTRARTHGLHGVVRPVARGETMALP